MKDGSFENEFQDKFTEMVELALAYVNNDKEEVDTIYIMALMETGAFFDVFYKINGVFVDLSKVNQALKKKCDDTTARRIELLKTGNRCCLETVRLFRDYNKEVPVVMKMTYSPKTGRFDNEIGYETLKGERTSAAVFTEWFENVKKGIVT